MGKKNTPGNIRELLKDLRRWSPYKKSLCESCEGLCCYMPVEIEIKDLIKLGILVDFHLELEVREQVAVALEHPAIARYTSSSKKFTLAQKPDGRCAFLSEQKRCTVYENRPETCRNHPLVGPRPGFCAYMRKEEKDL